MQPSSKSGTRKLSCNYRNFDQIIPRKYFKQIIVWNWQLFRLLIWLHFTDLFWIRFGILILIRIQNVKFGSGLEPAPIRIGAGSQPDPDRLRIRANISDPNPQHCQYRSIDLWYVIWTEYILRSCHNSMLLFSQWCSSVHFVLKAQNYTWFDYTNHIHF